MLTLVPTNGAVHMYVQGDLIGRIFGYWAIVFFGQIFESYRSYAYSWATFFPPDKLCIFF
jgi:hypothetical protein